MTMYKHFDVIVIGGNLVGATFALNLAKLNPKFSIAIIESTPLKFDFEKLDSRIYAISPQNVKFLTMLGIDFENNPRISTIEQMQIYGDNGGELSLDSFSANHEYLAKLTESKIILSQLYEELKECLNVHFIYGNVKDIFELNNLQQIVLEDSSYTTSLVVGADGANSIVRGKMSVDKQVIDYNQNGIVANFTTEKPHNNIAYQWFGADGVLAFLPLPNQQISIVYSTNKFDSLSKLNDLEFSNLIAQLSDHSLGKLQIVTPRDYFPLKLQLIDPSYDKQKVLIGDSLHTIHPLAGQGVNLGFSDAKLLSEILSAVEPYQLADSILLAKYNNLRKIPIRQMQLICHGLNRIFGVSSKPLGIVRNLGLNLLNNTNFLKKYLINQAINY